MPTENLEQSFKELFEKRQATCDWIKSGTDYNYAYPWENDNHPYKNLCNTLLWCEFWFEKIKISNYLRDRLSKHNSKLDPIRNDMLFDMVQKTYSLANAIKKQVILSISTDEVNNSDRFFDVELSQYNAERSLFQNLDPTLSFIHKKLKLIRESLSVMSPILTKNQIIMEDFKKCFVDSHLNTDVLEMNLCKLVDKYGMEALNQYAKCAWISSRRYIGFDIKLIVEDASLFIYKSLLHDKVQNQIMLEKILTVFFSELYAYYEANKQVADILNDVETKKFDTWNSCFLDNVMQLYTKKVVISRIESFSDAIPKDRFDYVSEAEWKTEINHEKLLWKLAIKGCVTEKQSMQINLSKEDVWLIDVYNILCMLQKLTIQINLDEEINRKLLTSINNFSVNKKLYGIYEIILFFIGECTVDMKDSKILEEMKAAALIILDYSKFEVISRFH